MKRINTYYWICTGLFAALMFFSAVPDVLNMPDAITFMTKLGYPKYFIPFIGIIKMIGVIALLLPINPRIKEWAYAGMSFDLLGAVYSIIASGGANAGMIFMLLWILPLAGSYIFYHRKLAFHAGKLAV